MWSDGSSARVTFAEASETNIMRLTPRLSYQENERRQHKVVLPLTWFTPHGYKPTSVGWLSTVAPPCRVGLFVPPRILAARLAPSRGGDPAVLVASSEKIRRVLGWEPQHSDIESIVRSAWEWHRSRG